MAAEPTNLSTPPKSSNPSEPQSAQSYVKRQKYYYVMRALKNEGVDDIFSEDANVVSGYLLSELISLRQEREGGNTVVVNYNDIQNSKEINFVTISAISLSNIAVGERYWTSISDFDMRERAPRAISDFNIRERAPRAILDLDIGERCLRAISHSDMALQYPTLLLDLTEEKSCTPTSLSNIRYRSWI